MAFVVGGVLAVGGSYSTLDAEASSRAPSRAGLIPFLKPLADYGWAVGLASSFLLYAALSLNSRTRTRTSA